MTVRERYAWGAIALVLAVVCFATGFPVAGSILVLWGAVWLVYAYRSSRPQ